MLRIAEYIDSSRDPVGRLAQHCGITAVVGGRPPVRLALGERLCDLASVARMKQDCEPEPAAASRQSKRPAMWSTVEGDRNSEAGHASLGRLYAIGCIRGLQQAVYAEATP